jgi:hypothetical protein
MANLSIKGLCMTDEELRELIAGAFDIMAVSNKAKQLKVFLDKDGLPFFEFIIEGQNEGKFTITYALPISDFKSIADRFIGTSFEKQDLAGSWKKNAIQKITVHAILLTMLTEAAFQQTAYDLTFLVEKIKSLADRQTEARILRFANVKSNGFSFDKSANELANEFAENQRRSGKELFLRVAKLLPEELPAKRFLFAIYYNHFLLDWRSAKKKLYKKQKT